MHRGVQILGTWCAGSKRLGPKASTLRIDSIPKDSPGVVFRREWGHVHGGHEDVSSPVPYLRGSRHSERRLLFRPCQSSLQGIYPVVQVSGSSQPPFTGFQRGYPRPVRRRGSYYPSGLPVAFEGFRTSEREANPTGALLISSVKSSTPEIRLREANVTGALGSSLRSCISETRGAQRRIVHP